VCPVVVSIVTPISLHCVALWYGGSVAQRFSIPRWAAVRRNLLVAADPSGTSRAPGARAIPVI